MRALSLSLALLAMSVSHVASTGSVAVLPLCEDVGVALPFALDCETDSDCETAERAERAAFCAAQPEHVYCRCR